MSISKQISIPMETSAYYQAQSNLNVTLWNQDKNTAELRFLITRNNFPLSLSTENVNIILALESGESFITTDDIDIDNEVEGVATYIIPEEFMAVATSVVGQVYVATIDGDEIVVQRKFSFEVAEDLLSTIPAEEKIRYIKMFDDLRVDMNNRLGSIETAIETLEANVDAVNNARENGITAINNLHDAKTVTFNQNFDDKMALLNASFNTMETFVADSQADMIAKKEAFDTAVTESGLVTDADATNWQKYKLTKDDGTRTYLSKGSFEDVNALEPGYYETVSNDTPTQGFPLEFANAAFIEIDVTKSSSESGRKQITVTQSSRGQTFVKFLHTDGTDNGWKEIPYVNPADPYETVNSSQGKANAAENNAKEYTDTKLAATRSTLFSGSVNGVNQNINLTESMDNYSILIISGNYTGGTFTEAALVSTIGSGIPIQRINLSNVTGGSPNVYESELSRESSTRFKIIRDNRYSILGENATMDSNDYTVKRIEAIK